MSTSTVALQDLIVRATGGREPNPKRHLKASALYHVLSDPFWIWCSYNAPQDQAVDEASEYDRLRMKRGIQFEEEWIRQNYPDAKRVEPAWGYQSLVNTLKAMLAGERAIAAPQLWLLPEEIYGKGDLLLRVDGQPSDLGDFSYQVVECKRSNQVKEYHGVQAAAYHKTVSAIQGRTLDTFAIALPSGVVQIGYQEYEKTLKDAIETWKKLRSNTVQPEPRGYDKTDSPWSIYANRVMKDRMDLTLLPDVGPATRETIRKRLGAKSISDLYTVSLEDLVAAMGATAGTTIFYCTRAYREGRPVVPPNTWVNIPRRTRTFALDFETSDGLGPDVAQPPHAYLAGIWDYQEQKFVRFLARGPKEEAKMFKDLLNHLGDLRDTYVHTWTNYEMGVIKAAGERHPELLGRLTALADACVDLKEAIKSQVYLPVATYSIKAVAPFLGFKWRHAGYGAFDSMTAYWEWLQGAPESVMRRALDYHEDDLLSICHVVRTLEGLAGDAE